MEFDYGRFFWLGEGFTRGAIRVEAVSEIPHYLGLRFRPETWDGSDVFSPQQTGFVFVTRDLRDALIDAKVTNLSAEPLDEVHRFAPEPGAED